MSENRVIGVVPGCGGAGATVFAAVLAWCAGETCRADPDSGVRKARRGRVFLLDCDPMGGGIDVLLGCEQVPGPRWGQVLLGGGRLDPSVLVDGLPRWRRVSFLAADSAAEQEPGALCQVIEAAAGAGTVVLDLPRWPSAARAAALELCDRVLLVTPAEVKAVTASALVAAHLDPEVSGVAVRGSCRALPASRVGALLGLAVIGQLPYDRASLHPTGLGGRKLRRATRRVALSALRLPADPRTAA